MEPASASHCGSSDMAGRRVRACADTQPLSVGVQEYIKPALADVDTDHDGSRAAATRFCLSSHAGRRGLPFICSGPNPVKGTDPAFPRP
jgi:hypothetical protein